MIDYIDVVVKDNDSISVTGRLVVNAGHVMLNQESDTYHVRCVAHGVKIEISALQAETVEDSTAFCQHCLKNEPPIDQTDPLTMMLAKQFQHAKANVDITAFIDQLDI